MTAEGQRRRSADRRAAVSPSAARSRGASPFQAAANWIWNVLPGGTARPFPRHAWLVDAVEKLVSIGHRDPGVAHPNVELALVFLGGVLRELCALSSHPPCVLGLRSHRLAFYCQLIRTHRICLSGPASVRSTTQRGPFFVCVRAQRPIFLFACALIWNEIEALRLPLERE
jgi:hypothetical protein